MQTALFEGGGGSAYPLHFVIACILSHIFSFSNFLYKQKALRWYRTSNGRSGWPGMNREILSGNHHENVYEISLRISELFDLKFKSLNRNSKIFKSKLNRNSLQIKFAIFTKNIYTIPRIYRCL